MTFWCPCVTYGRLTELSGTGLLGSGKDSCLINGCAWYWITELFGSVGSGVLGMITRGRIEEKYNLRRTSPGKSFCLHCCCPCVGLVQEYKAVEELQPRYEAAMSQPQPAVAYVAPTMEVAHQSVPGV
mmetsp:Transcript_36768/g.95207  ORF Transcript_36768/g.95207 Transcript_36768/m.95207 type:complete len:128 (-) Transcript_36768:315-698(-)